MAGLPEFKIPSRIDGNELHLREWRLDAAGIEVVVLGNGDPAVVAERPASVRAAVGVISSEMAVQLILGGHAAASEGRGVALAVCADDDDRIIGGLDADVLDDDPEKLEIGFWLLGAERGRGFAARAVCALIGWLAQERPNGRLWAEVRAGNRASLATLQRCGFTEPGNQPLPRSLPADAGKVFHPPVLPQLDLRSST
jgi:RimJ/RimL family protein N-acetyltransferase